MAHGRTAFLIVALLCVTSSVCSETNGPSAEAADVSLQDVIRMLEKQSLEIRDLKLENQQKVKEMELENQQKIKEVEQQLNTKIQQQNVKIESLERNCATFQPMKTFDSPVAFTAGLSQTFSAREDFVIVPYDVNFLNHGEAYSFEDHHFTAPVRGLYWFTISLNVENGYGARVILEVNGQKIVAAVDTKYGDAVSAILMLEAGDRVTCLKELSAQDLVEVFPDWRHNVFSGFLYTQL